MSGAGSHGAAARVLPVGGPGPDRAPGPRPASGAGWDRIEAWARYAALVAEQEAALDANDLERFQALSLDRQELQARVDRLHRTGIAVDTSPEAEARVRRQLERALEADRRILDRLGKLRRETRREVEVVDRRGAQARRYLGPGDDARGEVDLTF